MSCARKNLDWEKMFELAIDPKKARTYRQQAKPKKKILAVCAVISVL